MVNEIPIFLYDDIIKWNRFSYYGSFVYRSHQSLVDHAHKVQNFGHYFEVSRCPNKQVVGNLRRRDTDVTLLYGMDSSWSSTNLDLL